MENGFLSDILPITMPKLVPKQKTLEFIEIWLNLFFKHTDLYFDVKNDFY